MANAKGKALIQSLKNPGYAGDTGRIPPDPDRRPLTMKDMASGVIPPQDSGKPPTDPAKDTQPKRR